MNASLDTHPQLIPALTAALSVYDRGTAEHSRRVSQNSERLAEALGLEGRSLEAIAWAGLLHDLGKLAIADQILHKPGALTPEEWTEVQRHPAVGAEMLLALSPQLAPIAAGVRSHHERWDGTGYPDGVAGEVIPLAGRILTVADVFDSLTHPRGYRRDVWTRDDAIEYLASHAGSQFDPSAVQEFLRLERDGYIVCH